jgi:hypothetical protein
VSAVDTIDMAEQTAVESGLASDEATSVSATPPPLRGPLGVQRRALLAERPPALGTGWAGDWCKQMRLESRVVTGGWPGTLPEARARVLEHIDAELRRQGMPLLTTVEIAAATTTTYERARGEWLRAVRDAKIKRPRRAKP